MVLIIGGPVVQFIGMRYGLNGLRESVTRIEANGEEIRDDVKILIAKDAEQDKEIALNKQGLKHVVDIIDRRRGKDGF